MHKKLHCQMANPYWQMTKEKNVQANSAIASKLSEKLKSPRLEGICIGVTGSDGRLEKGFRSKVEVVLLSSHSDGDLKKSASAVMDMIKAESDVFESLLEIRKIREETLNFAFNDSNRVYPGRVLDCAHLLGDLNTLRAAKRMVALEWKNPKIRKKIKARKREWKKAMLTGRQRLRGDEIVNYDLVKGVAYLTTNGDPDTLFRGSFKFGPLRYVQFSLLSELAESVHNFEAESLAGFVEELPTPTVERIELLSSEKIIKLSPMERDEVIDSYIHFLSLYHESEHRRIEGKKETSFDTEEIMARMQALSIILG